MAVTESPPPEGAPLATEPAAARRETWFRVVLLGLVILVLGFTAVLLGQAAYPCVPAAGSTVEPPLADCAVALSPWIGLAALGFLLALLGYLRVR